MDILIDTTHAGERVDTAIASLAGHLSRSRVKQLIENGLVLVNDRPCKASQTLKAGDLIRWEEPEESSHTPLPEKIALTILFEDNALMVLDKPAGLVVHPAAGNWSGTLVNALLHHCETLSEVGGALRPGIIHRLDKDTTGCMVIAKNDATHHALAAQFSGRETLKIYLALVAGIPRPESGSIVAPIGRHKVHRQRMAVVSEDTGRAARTDYRVVQKLGTDAVVECALFTGRTHQIRVHLKHIGTPLRGDTTYAGRAAGRFPRPMLHAHRLGFHHPKSKKWMEFTAPLPDDFIQAGITR